MIELFQMWALVETLGILVLPLTVTVFHNLPDRGWAFSKTLGLAVFAFAVWLPLMTLRFLPFNQLFIAGMLLLLFVGNGVGFLRARHTLAKLLRSNLSYIVLTEVLFLGMVFLLGWLRSFGPDIRSYEMFMDEGFLAAIMRSPHFPPADMWFAGYSLNYYYYAHFMIAMLAKLIGQSPSIAFNTGICIFFGLTAANLFGVTCNIVSWARHLRGQMRTTPTFEVEESNTVYPPLLGSVPFGLLSMVMGLILGNLAATQQWWISHGNASSYDWFGPSRVIDKTINEFPSFSFLLSCFHAHVMALAFTIMAIGLAFNLLLAGDGKGLFVYGRGWRLFFTLVTSALILGGLFTMNGWDFPTYVGLACVCIGLQQWLAYGARFRPIILLEIFTACGSLVALSLLLYLPFYLNFVSPSQGIGLVAANERSPLGNELLIYGLFAFVFLSLLVASVSKRPRFGLSRIVGITSDDEIRRWSRIGMIAIGCFIVLSLGLLILVQNSATLVVATSIALAGAILLFYHIGNRAHAFTLLVGVLAFTLVAACEVFFLKDVFAGNYPRMNTVFKFYFQAWALLSIASGAGLFFILESFRPVQTAALDLRILQRVGSALWGIGLVALFVSSVVYPLSAPYTRYVRVDPATQRRYLQRSDSLDGLTYLKTDPAYPGDYAAIRWLNANVPGNPGIIEAIGDDYSNYGRISVFTGLPAPMGWVGHEYQWRVTWLNREGNDVEFERRSSDVDSIYTNTSQTVVLSLMARYQAQYLYVGPLEKAKYPNADLHRFSSYMQVVYTADGVTIYKVR